MHHDQHIGQSFTGTSGAGHREERLGRSKTRYAQARRLAGENCAYRSKSSQLQSRRRPPIEVPHSRLSYLLQTKCQQEDDEDNEEAGGGDSREQDGRDDAEYDAMLISTGGDLLPILTSIACTGKVPFLPGYLSSIIPKLQKRLVSLDLYHLKVFK